MQMKSTAVFTRIINLVVQNQFQVTSAYKLKMEKSTKKAIMIVLLSFGAAILIYFWMAVMDRVKLLETRDRDDIKKFTNLEINTTYMEEQLKSFTKVYEQIENEQKTTEGAVETIEQAKKTFT